MLVQPFALGSSRWDQGAPATLRLTAVVKKNLSALSGVAYKKLGAILSSVVAPNPAPKPRMHDSTTRTIQRMGHIALRSDTIGTKFPIIFRA